MLHVNREEYSQIVMRLFVFYKICQFHFKNIGLNETASSQKGDCPHLQKEKKEKENSLSRHWGNFTLCYYSFHLNAWYAHTDPVDMPFSDISVLNTLAYKRADTESTNTHKSTTVFVLF